MKVEFDYSAPRAPPPRIVVFLDEGDLERVKKGETLRSN